MMIKQFIENLFQKNDVVELRLIQDSRFGKKIHSEFVEIGANTDIAAKTIQDIIEQYNDEHHIYFGVNPRLGQSTKDISRISSVFVDIDAKDFASLEAYQQHIDSTLENFSKIGLMPSIQVNSGHGVHWYWTLKTAWQIELENDRQVCPAWCELQCALIDFCNSDKGIKDLPRILRMPASNNIKNQDDIITCTVTENNRSRFAKSNFTSILKAYREKIKAHEKEAAKELKSFKGEHSSVIQEVVLDILAEKANVSDYHDWLALAMSCKSAGLSYSQVDMVFAGSLGYDYAKNERMYNKMQPRSSNFGYAYNLAKSLEPSIKAIISQKLSVIDGEKKQAWYPGYIFEANGKTYIVKKKRSGEEIELYQSEIANFTARLTAQIFDDAKQNSWMLQINDKKEFEISGRELCCISEFRQAIASKGLYLLDITDTPTFNRFVSYIHAGSTIEEKRKTKYIGRAKGKNFVFHNGIATPGAVEPLTGLVLSPGKLNVYMPNNDLKQYWRNIIDSLHQLYLDELWKMVGFAVGSVFVDEISNEYACFPLLFLNGGKGCGKSTLFNFMLDFFGARNEAKPQNVLSTQKSRSRKASKYRGIPVVVNEFQANKKQNAVIQAFYDREGYDRAEKSNDLNTVDTPINSTFILASTRNITGYESEAVNSRMITIDYEKTQRNSDVITQLRKERKTLSSFVPLALLIDIPKLLQAIEAECIQLESSTQADRRLIENHAMVKCCANAFFELLGVEEKFGKSGIGKDIESQDERTKASSSARLFLSILDSMIEKGEIPNHQAQREDNKLIFHFSVYEQIKRFASMTYGKESLPDKHTMQKLLKAEGATGENSRKLGTTTTKWVWSVNYQD